MIAFVRCSKCRAEDRLLVQKLKEQGFEVRDVKKNPQWRKEAREYGLSLPFKVVDGVAEKL